MVRNVTEPEFGSRRGGPKGAAHRPGRGGVYDRDPRAIGDATFAFDADLVKTPTVRGEERRMAAGGEFWMFTAGAWVSGAASAPARSMSRGGRRAEASARRSVRARS
jgi:hypothetical protein